MNALGPSTSCDGRLKKIERRVWMNSLARLHDSCEKGGSVVANFVMTNTGDGRTQVLIFCWLPG